jgi:hypothetical protein
MILQSPNGFSNSRPFLIFVLQRRLDRVISQLAVSHNCENALQPGSKNLNFLAFDPAFLYTNTSWAVLAFVIIPVPIESRLA